MPIIRFANDKKPHLTVEAGVNLMQALLQADIPVASSCHGDGVCAKCKIQIVSGQENLSAANDVELELVQRNQIPKPFRISCQTLVSGDITVDATYW